MFTAGTKFTREVVVLLVRKGDEVHEEPRAAEAFATVNPEHDHPIHIHMIRKNVSVGVPSVLMESGYQHIYEPQVLTHTRSGRNQENVLRDKLLELGICSTDQILLESVINENGESVVQAKAFSGDRSELFELLPKNAVCAEIGIDTGGNAKDRIVPLTNPKELYLIDPWELCAQSVEMWHDDSITKHKANREHVEELFKDNPNVKIIQDFSVPVADSFENEYFDWVHFDCSVQYNDARRDLLHWLPKVKRGGYITGGMFCLEDHAWAGTFGAVMEFLIKDVIGRPELLEKEEERRNEVINGYISFLRKAGTKPKVYKKEYPFGDILLTHKFSTPFINHDHLVTGRPEKVKWGELVLQIKPTWETYQALADCKWFRFVPDGRIRGSNYCIEVGDWVDKLDLDKLIKEADAATEYHDWERVKI